MQGLEGHKDGPVILGARPLQYAHNLELDVLLGHEDHIAYLTLFKLRRLIPHDRLVGVVIGKPAPLSEFEKGLQFGETLGFYAKVSGYAPALPFVRIKDGRHEEWRDFVYFGLFSDVLRNRLFHVLEACPSLQHQGGRLIGTALGHDHQLKAHVVYILVERGFIAMVEPQQAYKDPRGKGNAHQGQKAANPFSQ